jgi:SAM-dependent methyltransferase
MSEARFDTYFHDRARRFSSFYRSESVARLLGRGPLFERLNFAVNTVVTLKATKVLDVGCGSGPLFEPLVEHDIHVTGIDPAEAMVDLARAQEKIHPELISVEQRGWEQIDEVDTYDVAVALGVFDYVDDSSDLLRRMIGAAPHAVASFPAPGLRLELRKIRYGARGVNVHPYTEQTIRDLADGSGSTVALMQPLGHAGFAVHFERS